MRLIRGYKSMSNERLLSALGESNESSSNVNNFNNTGIKKIRKDFSKLRHRFSKSKINELTKFYITQKPKKIFLHQKQKRLRKVLIIKKSLCSLKKHHHYDDTVCKGIRNIRNLFGENDDYYEPTKTKGAFNDNYIEYESRGDKNLLL